MAPVIKRIRLEHSDGTGKTPDNVSSAMPKLGSNFDYYRLISEDEPKYQRWLSQLGAFLKAETVLKETADTYELEGFPQGYTFLEQCKSLAGNDKKYRTDTYLYGHPSGSRAFRSVNEFMPHLLWLSKDTTHDPANCLCKYCTGAKTMAETGFSAPARRRQQKSGTSLLGMSEMGKANMVAAQKELAKDLAPNAHRYRIGEVVWKRSHRPAVLIAAQTYVNEAKTLASDTTSQVAAFAQQTYTVVDLQEPFKSTFNVPHDELEPYLIRSSKELPSLPIVDSASPIAKYNHDRASATSLSGPCYVAWYLGPEKIYQEDLVRVSDDQLPEIMQISHIMLDRGSKTIRARGDIWQFVDFSEIEEERPVPLAILDLAKKFDKKVECMNSPGQEFEMPLSEVRGRFYQGYTGDLRAVSSSLTVKRGRRSDLDPALVIAMEQIFETEEDTTADDLVNLGTRNAPYPHSPEQLLKRLASEPLEAESSKHQK